MGGSAGGGAGAGPGSSVGEGGPEPGRWQVGKVWEEVSPWATLSLPTRCTTCQLPAHHSTLHLPILSESFCPVLGGQ